MEFIHIADVHLGVGERMRQPGLDAAEPTTAAFLQVIEDCNQENIDVLFVAGDLFHRPPSIRELQFVIDQFNRLTKTLVLLIAGNHDHIEAGSAWLQVELPRHVVFFQSEKVAMCELKQWRLRVYGSSFLEEQDDRRLPGSRLSLQDGFHHFLLGHGGDAQHHPFAREDLRRYTYAALGHLHQMQQVGATAFYAGSPAPVYEWEDWLHGYIRGHLDVDSGRLEADFRILPNPPSSLTNGQEEKQNDTAAGSHEAASPVPPGSETVLTSSRERVSASSIDEGSPSSLEEDFRALCGELPIGRRQAVLDLGLWALRRAKEDDDAY